MKRIVVAVLMLGIGVSLAGIEDPNDSYSEDGEWVEMASEATGVDSGKIIDGILKGLEQVELRQGINEEGLAVVDRWLALDRETRIKMPIKVDSLRFAKDNEDGAANGGREVCLPGDDPDPFGGNPENGGDSFNGDKRFHGLKPLKLVD